MSVVAQILTLEDLVLKNRKCDSISKPETDFVLPEIENRL